MNVQLPGGLLNSQTLEKQARLRVIDGHIENACQARVLSGQGNPMDVAALLNRVVASIGHTPVQKEMIQSLCWGDCKYLLVCLCILLKGPVFWFENTCNACEELYDIQIDLEALPVKPAGEGFPFAKTLLQGKEIFLRVPTGNDLAAIMGMDPKEAVHWLAQGSIQGGKGVAPYDLGDSDIDRIADALEREAPDVGTRIQTQCPSCKCDELVTMDLWEMLRQCVKQGSIFSDVDRLASHYHWSEKEILSLTREKRQIYLKLIDARQGISS